MAVIIFSKLFNCHFKGSALAIVVGDVTFSSGALYYYLDFEHELLLTCEFLGLYVLLVHSHSIKKKIKSNPNLNLIMIISNTVNVSMKPPGHCVLKL